MAAELNEVISQNVFIKSFCKRQFPHKSVNLSFINTNTKNKLMNLCGNGLLRNGFQNAFCGIRGEEASLPNEAGTIKRGLRTLTCKLRPGYGLDCLIYAIFARQRGLELSSRETPTLPPLKADLGVFLNAGCMVSSRICMGFGHVTVQHSVR